MHHSLKCYVLNNLLAVPAQGSRIGGLVLVPFRISAGSDTWAGPYEGARAHLTILPYVFARLEVRKLVVVHLPLFGDLPRVKPHHRQNHLGFRCHYGAHGTSNAISSVWLCSDLCRLVF